MSYDNAKDELILYTDNDFEMYRQRQPFLDNIKRRIKNKTYKPLAANKLWLYYVERAVRRYGKEIMSSEKAALQAFPPKVRKEVAAYYAREAEKELGYRK